MIYSNREYALTDEAIPEPVTEQMQLFLDDNEEALYTFDNSEVIAFFTDKKILFVRSDTARVYETEALPYQSIVRCIVLGLPNAEHGKLELVVSDEIVITFYIPEYADAVKLCRIILQY